MTRASHNAPTCVMMSHIKQSRRNGGGGSYPQWMRTLEDKYQKLHKKIAENTSVGYGRFNSCVGRSVYDTRLSQALLRYKDQAFQKPSLRSKSTRQETVTNNDVEVSDLCTDGKIELGQNQYLDNEIDLPDDENGANNCDNIEKDGNLTQDCDKILPSSSNKILDVHDDSSIEDCIVLADIDSSGKQHGLGDAVNEPSSEIIKRGVRKKDLTRQMQEVSANNQYSRKYLKTSVSRTSKITTKSCPAKLQSKTLNQKHLLNGRSKSANRNDKMFTPMSAEAKHAITETIHEMNLSTPDTMHRPDTVQFIPSRGRKCVKSWGMPRKTKSFFDVRKVPDNGSQCLEDLQSDGENLRERQPDDDGDKASCLSSAGSTADQRSSSRLPDIQAGSVRDKGSIRNSSYRLPGIGKYNIAQDDPVFEITPLGFDSRYNDVLVVEERESETPPPDIRQRAIDKCAEWLTKYNK